jgi:hypothetical protein
MSTFYLYVNQKKTIKTIWSYSADATAARQRERGAMWRAHQKWIAKSCHDGDPKLVIRLARPPARPHARMRFLFISSSGREHPAYCNENLIAVPVELCCFVLPVSGVLFAQTPPSSRHASWLKGRCVPWFCVGSMLMTAGENHGSLKHAALVEH